MSKEREEGLQNPLIHEGVPPEGDRDTNEKADDRVEVVEPDGSESPRS